VIFPLEGGSRLITLMDPDLGDRLYVVPVATAGVGLAVSRRFPQFQALGSFQGLVVASLSDTARLQLEADGLRVSGAGLQVTPEIIEAGTGEDSRAKRHRLLHLADWRWGGEREFLGNRQLLQRNAVAPSDPSKLDLARLELARFYFAHGLASEARSVLNLTARDSTRFTRDPELILLRAASAFLVQDYLAAAAGLADPALADEWDAVTWRAALAAAAQDWAYAAQLFDRAEPLIGVYSRAVRVRLGLLAAEARLGIGDSGGASLYLERIRQEQPKPFEQTQLDYLEGRRLMIDNQGDKAVELWQKVASSAHRPSQARARLALLEYGLDQGSLGTEAAIAELEHLRFLWRGDQFEVALLERLAELYEAQGEYRAALHALRQAASHFPGSAHAKAAARHMTDIFVAVNLGESKSALPPLKTMALYEEFKELTPVGAVGNRLVERLIDRLVTVDLLERAAKLLAEQIAQRLKGMERDQALNRLALIYLLDRRPQDAVDTLAAAPARDDTQASAGILMERRRLMVRALADLGRSPEALDLLRGDESEAAQKLRAELLWELADWPAAAVALARFVPEMPPAGRPLEASERRAVTNLAIAHTLAGDRRALNDLARRYGPAMAGGPDAEAFTLLISDFDSPQLGAITEELAGVDTVQAFLAGYKARMAEAGLSGVN
jgi:tetratricopeptide (TPR) repeat protein